MGCQSTSEPGPSIVLEQLWRTATGIDSNINLNNNKNNVNFNHHNNININIHNNNNNNLPSHLSQIGTCGISAPILNPVSFSVSSSQLIPLKIGSTIQSQLNPISELSNPIPSMVSTTPSFVPLTSGMGLSIFQQQQQQPSCLSAPASGVIMSTSVVTNTVTPTTLFQLQQQQQQQQQHFLFQQQQLSMLASVNANQINQSVNNNIHNNVLRRSELNQNRVHSSRFVQNALDLVRIFI